jgi:hypothetical protein
MPKRKRIKHAVKASLEVPGLARPAARLKVYADRQKLGEITLGRGSLYWYGRHRQKHRRISWTRFAAMMDELAYGK